VSGAHTALEKSDANARLGKDTNAILQMILTLRHDIEQLKTEVAQLKQGQWNANNQASSSPPYLSYHRDAPVIAHEIAHITNGDMVTMTLLQGVLNTFVIFLSRMISTAVASTKDENGNSSTNTMVFWIADIVLQMVFGVIATMIAMWFSRYREYRADAGSAKLVGKEKMIMALQRLQRVHEPQEMEGSLAAFMINGVSSKELFMSHPPLEKRIEALRNL